MTTTERGQRAETRAADYLVAEGYEVVARNWRTRWCEIDIIAKKPQMLVFAEVKYRATDHQGDGLDYITATKLRQMTFAAQLWVAQHNYDGAYGLLAIAVSGPHFRVTDCVEI